MTDTIDEDIAGLLRIAKQRLEQRSRDEHLPLQSERGTLARMEREASELQRLAYEVRVLGSDDDAA